MICPTRPKPSEFEAWTVKVIKLLQENNLITIDDENGIIPAHSDENGLFLIGYREALQKAQFAFQWHEKYIESFKGNLQ